MIQETSLRPAIPETAYKKIKRCPNCQSVYLTDTHCEACGRSLLYHPIGDPFSAKSLYGFKERYYESLPILVKHFPLLENKKDPKAKSYTRMLTKRFDDLIEAFGEVDTIAAKNRRLFYVEVMELMDELLRYGVTAFYLQQRIEASALKTGPLLTQELLLYLNETKDSNHAGEAWTKVVMNHRVFGLRVEWMIKVALMTATILVVAISYYHFVNSQFGK